MEEKSRQTPLGMTTLVARRHSSFDQDATLKGWRYMGTGASDFEADEAHEFEGVALRNDSVAQLEIEAHFSVLDEILKVGIAHNAADGCGHVRERQIVCGDHSNGAVVDQRAYEAFCSDSAVMRIGTF
jgi:allantoicase